MEISIEDRFQIQDLLAEYCFSLDDHDWESFLKLFHPEAVLDFSSIGGIKGKPKELVEFLQVFSENVHRWQHTTSTNRLTADNDHILSRTAAQVMTITKSPEGEENTAFFGLWYNDKLKKINGRWLITERVLQSSWTHNIPE